MTALDEAARLCFEPLDTPAAEDLDGLVRLASRVFRTPMALVSVVEEQRQRLTATVGLDVTELSREHAVGARGCQDDEVFVVEDTLQDPWWREHPLVTGEPRLRFCAGASLEGGRASLCVLDRAPRCFQEADRETLRLLGRHASALFDAQRGRARAETLARSLAEAQEIAHVGSWDWRLDENRVTWSDELCRIYGVTLGHRPTLKDVIGRVHPEDRAALSRVLEEGRRDGTPAILDHRIVRPDGSVRALFGRGRAERDAGGKVVRLLGTAQDVTELREVQAALLASERLSRSTIEALPDAVFRVTRAGTLRPVHTPAGFGDVRVSAFVPKTFFELAPPESANRATEALKKVLEGSPLEVFTYDSALSEPKVREARVVRYDHDEVLLLLRDVTERQLLERMKDELIATVSHELRTPLTALQSALSLLAAEAVADDPALMREMIDISNASAARLVRMVNDMLDVEKLEAHTLVLQPIETDALRIVEGTLASLRPLAAESSIQLTAEVPELPLLGDEDRLIQVLTNLVANAIKYAPPGTAVTVRAERRGEAAWFEVEDRGPGIPAEKREGLFTRFRQLDASDRRAKGGAGLGLAIARSIVELHGGTIGITSAAPGARFWFELPLRPPGEGVETTPHFTAQNG